MNNEEALELLLMIADLGEKRPLSLARLAKQSGKAMSTLMRQLAVLEDLHLVCRDGDFVRVAPMDNAGTSSSSQ